MKDIKDFIKVADLYAQDSLTENKKIEEGLGDWLMDKLGFGMPEAEAVVDAAKAEAETLDIDPEVVDTTEIVGSASTDTTGTTDTTADNDNQRPTENAEGDPYDIINSRQQVEAGQVGAQARLDKGLAELKADQEAWDEENPGAYTEPKTVVQNPDGSASTGTDGAEVKPTTNAPTDAELDTSNAALASNNPNTTFDSINDAQKADNLTAGDIITIDGIEAEVDQGSDGQQFFVHPGSNITIEKPKPPAPQDELSATDTTVAPGTGAGGPAGGTKAPVDTPPPAQQSAGPDDGTRSGQEPNREPVAPSNGSLLGRKLDLKTPNLMKAYNDGGKQAMPTIRNMQTALSRLGFDPNGIDGKYGNGTFKAVQAFQKANGLTVDGQAGPNTMKSMKAILDKNFEKNKVTPSDTAKAAANNPAPTTQTASKDNNMKKAIEESASMNVSMTADNASEVADLMKLLKNAGMDDAKPVGDIMAPPMSPMSMEPPMPSDNMSDFVKMVDRGEKQDLPGDSSCSVCGDSHEEDSCSEEYDAIVDEWDNSPEEEYKDISAVIPDGNDLHKSKSSHRAAAGGDNAMAVEASIKEQLWAALNEKKADIKTTEGRGKVMAGRGRGKDKLMAGRGRGKKK
jgi:hypothetical protein